MLATVEVFIFFCLVSQKAFATVVTAAEKMDANSITSEERNEIIHARFIRAVSELELLGFVKPTKRKTDHVARLTWGGC